MNQSLFFQPVPDMESLPPLSTNSDDFPMSGHSSQLELDMPSADAVEISEIITSHLKGVDCSDVPSMEMEHLSINDEDFNELVSRERMKSADLEKEVNGSSDVTNLCAQKETNVVSRDEKVKGKEIEVNENASGLLIDINNKETCWENDGCHKEPDSVTADKLLNTDDYLDDINAIITSPEHTHSAVSQDRLSANNKLISCDDKDTIKSKMLLEDIKSKEATRPDKKVVINLSEKSNSSPMVKVRSENNLQIDNSERQKVTSPIDSDVIPEQLGKQSGLMGTTCPGAMVQLPELADSEVVRSSGSGPISPVGLVERGGSRHKPSQTRPILPKTTLPAVSSSSANTDSVITHKYPVRIHHTSGTNGNKLCLEVCRDDTSSLSIPSVVQDVISETVHIEDRRVEVDAPVSYLTRVSQHQVSSQAPLQNWSEFPCLPKKIPHQANGLNTMHEMQTGKQFGHVLAGNSLGVTLGNRSDNSVLSSASNENRNTFQMVTKSNSTPQVPYGGDLIIADRRALELLGVPYQPVPVPPGALQNTQANSHAVTQTFPQVNIQQEYIHKPVELAGQQPNQHYVVHQSTLPEQTLQPSQQVVFTNSNQNLGPPNLNQALKNSVDHSNLNLNFTFSNTLQKSDSDSSAALKQLPINVTQKNVAPVCSSTQMAGVYPIQTTQNPQAVSSTQGMIVLQQPATQRHEITGICLLPQQRAQIRKTLNNDKHKLKRLNNVILGKVGRSGRNSTSQSKVLYDNAPQESFMEYMKNSIDLSDELNQEIEQRKERLKFQEEGLLQNGIINDLVGQRLNDSAQNTCGSKMGTSSQSDVEKVESSIRLSGDLNLDLTKYLCSGSSQDKAGNGIHSSSLEKYLNLPDSTGHNPSSTMKDSTLPTEVGQVDILAWRQHAIDTGLSGFVHQSFMPESSIPGACAIEEKMVVSRDPSSFTYSSGGDCAMESGSLENGYGMNIVSQGQDPKDLVNGIYNLTSNSTSFTHHQNIPNDLQSLMNLLPANHQSRLETSVPSQCNRLNLQAGDQNIQSYQLTRIKEMKGVKTSSPNLAELPVSGSEPASHTVLNHNNRKLDVSMQQGSNLNDLSVHSERKTYNNFNSNANIVGNAHDKTMVYTDKLANFQDKPKSKSRSSKASKSQPEENFEKKRSRRRQGQPADVVAGWVNSVNMDAWSMSPSHAEDFQDLRDTRTHGHNLTEHTKSPQTHLHHQRYLTQQQISPQTSQHKSLANVGIIQQNPHQIQQHHHPQIQHYNSYNINNNIGPMLPHNNNSTALPQYYSPMKNVVIKTKTQPSFSHTFSSSMSPFSPQSTLQSLSQHQHQLQIFPTTKLTPRGSSNQPKGNGNNPNSTDDSHKSSSKSKSPHHNQAESHMLNLDINEAAKILVNSPNQSSESATVLAPSSSCTPLRTVPVPKSGKAASGSSVDVEVIASPSDDSDNYVYHQKEPTSIEEEESWGSGTSSMESEAKRRWFQSLGIDDEEDTPLHYLCDMPPNGDMFEKIRTNKNLKKVIDHTNNRQETALFVAVVKQNLHVVKFLVQNGADVNVMCKSDPKKYQRASPEYQTALHEAVETGNKEIIKILLSVQDVQIDSRRQVSYMTPLMLAVSCHIPSESDRMDIVKMLLRREASLGAQDTEGKSPLMYMVMAANAPLVRFILDRVGVQAARTLVTAVTKKKQMTCLHYVAQLKERKIDSAKKKELLRLLIEHGADPDKLNTDKQSPRHWASHEIFEVMSRLKTMTDVSSTQKSPHTTEELAASS